MKIYFINNNNNKFYLIFYVYKYLQFFFYYSALRHLDPHCISSHIKQIREYKCTWCIAQIMQLEG